MILVDTSVWVEHFRGRNRLLQPKLEQGEILMHSFIIGELACGQFKNRSHVFSLLEELPAVPVAKHDEVMGFLEAHRLAGLGLGWIDLHLLVSSKLVGASFWTVDRRLAHAAKKLMLDMDE